METFSVQRLESKDQDRKNNKMQDFFQKERGRAYTCDTSIQNSNRRKQTTPWQKTKNDEKMNKFTKRKLM